MQPSILVDIFKAHFQYPFEFSDHAIERIHTRFSILDKNNLNLLLQSFKRITKGKSLPDCFVIADDTYAISFVLKKDKQTNVFIMKTAIHGKLSEGYDDKPVFLCNIKKEKSLLETEILNQHHKNVRK
jgi:hypothetical protein